MKNLIKLFPAALGLIALASCSNDDFLSSKNADDLSDKYVLTATEEDDATTRAFKDVNQGNTTYQANEVMRVYDSNMAKYDEFKFQTSAAGSFFTIPGEDANITEKNAEGNLDYAYALFGTDGEKVSYAGWNGNNLALVKISDAQVYAESVSSLDGKTCVYKENLPQWGTVTSVVAEKTTAAKSFNTSLRYLTGRVKVVFENGANNGKPVQNVRVSSLKLKAGKTLADLLAGLEADAVDQKSVIVGGFAAKYSTIVEANPAKPISGWFEAVLDPAKTKDGIRQVEGADNKDAVNVAAGTTITESVAGGAIDSYTNVFFFPIVPDTYDLLVFEYEDADGWHFIDILTGDEAKIARGQKIETTDKDNWAAGIDLTVSNDMIVDREYIQNCEAVSKIMSDNTIAEAPVIINLNKNTAEYVKTIDTDVESQYTIYIPQLKNNMTVNFHKETLMYKKLVIKDATGADNSNFVVKFNFNSINNTEFEDIEISTTAKELKLEGDFTNLGAKEIKVLAGNVTVTADENTVSAETIIGKLVNKGTGIIGVKGNATNDLTLTTLDAGKATNVIVYGDAAKTNIEDLNTNECTDIEVSGGTVNNVNVGVAGTILVDLNGIVNNIKAGTDTDTDINITVKSADNGIVNAFTDQVGGAIKAGKYVYDISTEFTEFTTKDNAAQPASHEIYTAAQLNSIGGWANAAKMATTFTVTSGTWSSPDLPVNFDGDNKAIKNLNAPLFGEIKTAVTTITKLNISGANITAAAANCGVLAKVSKATNLAVTASTVAGTITSNKNFVGGMIGQVDAAAGNVSVKFGTDAAAVGAAATVTANVTLVNNKTYAAYDVLDTKAGTWGEYVGSVVNAGANSATVVINNDCAGATLVHTAKALKYDWKRDADFDAESRVQVIGYLKPTNCDNSLATRLWIGFVGTGTNAIPVVVPADITNITLTYPMTVNGVVKKVTFPHAAEATGNTEYTFAIDGLGHNDESGKKTGAAAPYAATIYHNAYAEAAY